MIDRLDGCSEQALIWITEGIEWHDYLRLSTSTRSPSLTVWLVNNW
jgi:hypothetical protein